MESRQGVRFGTTGLPVSPTVSMCLKFFKKSGPVENKILWGWHLECRLVKNKKLGLQQNIASLSHTACPCTVCTNNTSL